MKTKLNYTKLLIETVILTVAVAIIAAAVYFSWFQATPLSAVFQVLESCFPTLSRCHCLRSP